jgi:uncharacterized membrane protein
MNQAHLHLIFTHFPVVATLGACGILAFGLWRRQDLLIRTGLVILVLAGLASGASYLTGEGAEEALEHQPAVAKALIERHEAAGRFGLGASAVTGVLSLAVLLVSRRTALARGRAASLLAAGLVTCLVLAWTANLGGQIRHPEIGASVGADEPGAPESEKEQ